MFFFAPFASLRFQIDRKDARNAKNHNFRLGKVLLFRPVLVERESPPFSKPDNLLKSTGYALYSADSPSGGFDVHLPLLFV